MRVAGGRVGLWETGDVGGEFSLSSSSMRRMKFSAEPPISKSSNAVVENGVSLPGQKTPSTFNWSFSQLNSKPSRWDIWYPLVSISCAPTLECTSSLNAIVPFCLKVIGTRARWSFKKFCLPDGNTLQPVRGILWEFILLSWTKSLAVRVTRCGPKFRQHSVPSLEADKIMLLYCKLKV